MCVCVCVLCVATLTTFSCIIEPCLADWYGVSVENAAEKIYQLEGQKEGGREDKTVGERSEWKGGQVKGFKEWKNVGGRSRRGNM